MISDHLRHAVCAAALLALAGAGSAPAHGEGSVVLKRPGATVPLTGNLRTDILAPHALGNGPDGMERGDVIRKSPWIAAGLSLVLPGAGEFYAESYWKAAAFLAIEAAAWTVAYTYDRKGDRQTDFYQDYANAHWDVVRYAQYAEANLAPAGQTYAWRIGTTGLPWQQVDWAELNRMERDIGRTADGQYYSHTLPLWGEQQYYELIGKYQQFNQGWDDAPPSYRYGEPVTARFSYYSLERGKANDFYSTASAGVTVAILNHILSAVDAAWSAGSANSVHASLGMRALPLAGRGPAQPTAGLRYSF
ncbi:MAG: hypothetical protein WB626_11625 [Bacteroidota bacterium]